jgi:hypothetical protein
LITLATKPPDGEMATLLTGPAGGGEVAPKGATAGLSVPPERLGCVSSVAHSLASTSSRSDQTLIVLSSLPPLTSTEPPRPGKTHLVLRAEKKQHAMTNGTPNVLIDDYPQNIQQWKAEGGIGILHVSASQTIAQLKKLGYV